MHRLKTRPQFQSTLAGGTVARTAHFALHRLVLPVPGEAPPAFASASTGPEGAAPSPALFALPAGAAQAPWLGAMVPKRWARRAVTRNAIKRQIYTVAREHAQRLPHAAHVVRLRATFDRKQFISASSDLLKQAVRAELQQLFARAVRGPGPSGAA
ncbi:ribonuclease P protein component [Oryzisolibacter propanilivorax]|uniref:Ribonuclease P protein component n=1 Tax=Oryzisolibacter propanilivorax TaxID=1527607 RepID=A0A1G9QMJ2_9BURK|nr:ribonuclease P protein component [Oryzisolibacter propanilivorax]SDM12041.1 ribonuclease P protein component [Oryzisolibacter propanilivorax]